MFEQVQLKELLLHVTEIEMWNATSEILAKLIGEPEILSADHDIYTFENIDDIGTRGYLFRHPPHSGLCEANFHYVRLTFLRENVITYVSAFGSTENYALVQDFAGEVE